MTGKKGFTLIELLVVISIIAMLMGILMPVVGQVKRRANTLKCRSNLRQYVIAGRMYMHDHDGCFPTPHQCIVKDHNSPDYTPETCQWHMEGIPFDGLLCSYLKAGEIHLCATFKKLAKSKGCTNYFNDPSIPVVPQYSYSMNAYLGDGPYGVVRRESQVRDASRVFFFAEENVWRTGGQSTSGINNTHLLVRYPPHRSQDFSDRFATFHNVSWKRLDKGYGNVAWLDGHAEAVKADEQEDHGTFRFAWPKRFTHEMLQ